MKKLRTALIGLEERGEHYLSALRSDDGCEVVAVADTNASLLRGHVEGGSARVFEDYRSLIVECAREGLDLLVVTPAPFRSLEYLELAAAHGIDVLCGAPFARNLEEGKRVLDGFERNRCSLFVPRLFQNMPPFVDISELAKMTGRVHLAAARVRATSAADGWRGDSVRAGGGVLLNDAYQIIDFLISLLGMPESVVAQCSLRGGTGSVRKHDTEDAATVSLRFKGDRIGVVTAWRGARVSSTRLSLVGEKSTVELADGRMTVVDPEGRSLGRDAAQVADLHTVGTENRARPGGRRGPRPRKTSSAGRIRAGSGDVAPCGAMAGTTLRISDLVRRPPRTEEFLAASAVIDAAYLSARTASPETPALLLE